MNLATHSSTLERMLTSLKSRVEKESKSSSPGKRKTYMSFLDPQSAFSLTGRYQEFIDLLSSLVEEKKFVAESDELITLFHAVGNQLAGTSSDISRVSRAIQDLHQINDEGRVVPGPTNVCDKEDADYMDFIAQYETYTQELEMLSTYLTQLGVLRGELSHALRR